MPFLIKLRSARKDDSPPRDKSGPSSAALRMRQVRMRHKHDNERYTDYRKKENARIRQYRKNLDEEQKQRVREKTNLRMKRYRERQKELQKTQERALPRAPHTRQAEQKQEEKQSQQREKWRLAKKEQRARLTSQKKRRIREKDAARKRECRAQEAEKRKPKVTQNNAPHADVSDVVKTTLRDLKGPTKRVVLGELSKNINKNSLGKECAATLGVSAKLLKKYKGMNKESLLKRKQRKDALTEAMKTKIKNFYQNESTCLPNKKSVKSAKPRYVLRQSIERTHRRFRAKFPKLEVGLTAFMKLRPRNVLLQSCTKWLQCLCETCTNIDMSCKQINLSLGAPLIKDRFHLSELTMCSDTQYHAHLQCVDRKCENCGAGKLKEKLQPLLSGNVDRKTSWKRWSQVEYAPGKKRMTLVKKEGTVGELVDQLLSDVESFPRHLFEARWQQSQFSNVSENPPPSTLVCVMDFAEKYKCNMQEEVQSAHWYINSVTLHPFVGYYKCPNCDDQRPVREAVHIVSEDSLQDVHAVNHYVQLFADYIHQKNPAIDKMIQFSDGCAAQYKSKTAFADLSFASDDLPFNHVERNFFGSRHGKNPCDGEGGVVKNAVTRAVKSRNAVVTDAASFFEYCQNLRREDQRQGECNHSRRSFILVRENQINRDRPERTCVKTVTGTRSLHAVIGVSPYVIKTRRLSCFCQLCCTSEDGCDNADVADRWKERKLHKARNMTHAEVRLEGAEHEEIEHDLADVDTTHPDKTEDDRTNEDELANDDTIKQDKIKVDVTVSGDSITVKAVGPTGSGERLEYTADHPVPLAITDPMPTEAQFQVGEFVLINIPVGKKTKAYVGEVRKVLHTDGIQELLIQYMEETKPGVYRWPLKVDVSQELATNVVKRLPCPGVIENRNSSKRLQFYTFEI